MRAFLPDGCQLIMASPKEQPDLLVQLHQEIEQSEAKVNDLKQKFEAELDARLPELPAHFHFADMGAFIARLKKLGSAPNQLASASGKKAVRIVKNDAIRADLRLKTFSIDALATKHKVTNKVVAGIMSRMPELKEQGSSGGQNT
jgi:hypothetical protein